MKNLRQLLIYSGISFFILIFFNACGEMATDLITRITPAEPPVGKDKKVLSPEEKALKSFENELYEKLAKDIKKPALTRMLPLSTLYQTIREVPEQTSPWSCGNQQIMQSVAMAHIGAQEEIPAIVKECNVMGDYPALIDIEITPKNQFLITMAKNAGFIPSLEKLGNKSFLRIGALPRMLPGYVNPMLPKGVTAKLLGEENLNKTKLISALNRALDNEMPLIALYVIEAYSLSMHYYSIIGFSESDNKLIVLDALGVGVERIKIFAINDFIAGMNTSDFKKVIKDDLLGAINPLRSIIEKSLKPDEKLPDESEVDTLAPYNFITFEKD